MDQVGHFRIERSAQITRLGAVLPGSCWAALGVYNQFTLIIPEHVRVRPACLGVRLFPVGSLVEILDAAAFYVRTSIGLAAATAKFKSSKSCRATKLKVGSSYL